MGYKKERNKQLDRILEKFDELMEVYKDCDLVSTSDFIGFLETAKLETFTYAREVAHEETMEELSVMKLEDLLGYFDDKECACD